MTNQDTFISMVVSTDGVTGRRPSHRVYDWKEIDFAIDAVFSEGGTLSLTVQFKTPGETDAFRTKDSISIWAMPGKYVLVTFPFRIVGVRVSGGLRKWRQPDSKGPHGTVMLSDIEFDTRNLCDDPSVAKEILYEFFMEHEITQKIDDLTGSDAVPFPE